MKYVDGLNYLDQLKDYVQTSLSIKHNTIAHKVEQSEDVEQMGDPLSINEKVEEINYDEKMEADEVSKDFDLVVQKDEQSEDIENVEDCENSTHVKNSLSLKEEVEESDVNAWNDNHESIKLGETGNIEIIELRFGRYYVLHK